MSISILDYVNTIIYLVVMIHMSIDTFLLLHIHKPSLVVYLSLFHKD